ncbi:MAG: methylenetetrahydrofolate--tRNA-(uracil(54)-C(5))-methyltransferase (FADH(2)-oxidizing) TrmFO [Nitrospirae bacterium RIFCSPHIGHO2_01_FULL_66_17]|nr:MAG: methylenetetrahydrofolate--tRNA-(uracil(54)-C(5))-methyltransferase (FADH(2)-oxidizing) TrmFO [Nitrospirae bacterium RIFCSPHIGHO2_01_FULL_66_17]
MTQIPELTVLGGGLAGCEAAWQAAERGVQVALYEMRPQRPTAAHKTDQLAELVCSNSLGSSEITNAAGILKEEMRRLGSLVVRVADTCTVPAGAALAVDRAEFAARITKEISTHPNITVIREEVTTIPEQGPVIIATGPLTSDALAESLKTLTRAERLYFFDAISPIVDGETIDRSIAFGASRYNKGGADYLNCPMSRAEYDAFYDALIAAEKVPVREFEKTPYFEGCMPIEVQADRGRQTLLFGPMKPVGLVDPRTGARPHAVVQLRAEDVHGQAYNMVGFQTKLKWPEQKRVFRMIPGLERAEFLRLGSLHRNTFINAPLLVRETLQFRQESRIFFAGQIVGVEGYTESAGMGLLAGMNAARLIQHQPLLIPPPTTTLGTLITYLTKSDPRTFQPMNVNLGLFPPLPTRIVQREVRRQKIVDRALNDLDRWKTQSVSS